MTSIQRTLQRTSVAPLIAALAVAASFGAGVVVGGPVLHLATASSVISNGPSAAVLQSGRAWELQRIQQVPQRVQLGSVPNPGVLAGVQAWERERRQEMRGH